MPSSIGRNEVEVFTETENEMLVLASMMHDKSIMRDLTNSLDIESFSGDRNKFIFAILRDIESRKLYYDIETFNQLSKIKKWDGIKAKRDYVEKICKVYQTPTKNLKFHVDKLRLDAIKHNLRIGNLQRLIDLCNDSTSDLDQIRSLLKEVNKATALHIDKGVSYGNALYDKYVTSIKARIKDIGFVPTGFSWLDEDLTEGLARKRVSIWTGRPSIGKSTVAWNIADRLANKYNQKVLYLALEMDMIGILDGVVSCNSGISIKELVKGVGKLKKNNLVKINQTIKKVTGNGNLVFWDRSINNQKLLNILDDNNYAVVIFDLYEKMVRTKTQDVIAADLDVKQQMAKDCDCHLAIFHQTRRGVEQRTNKRPNLEDLKNSGGYEEVADLVVGLYRDKYYNSDLSNDIIEFGILKQRRGLTANWYYYDFDGAYGKVGDERRDWDPDGFNEEEDDDY